LLGAAMVAIGQGRQENVNRCEAGDLDARIVACTALIQAGQDTTEHLSFIYDNRGFAYNRKGDYDRAIQDYNEAIRLNPNEAFAYDARGRAYRNKGDYDHAIQDYSEAIHLNPNLKYVYNNRGEAYDHKGDYDRAIQNYNEAIRLNPDDTTVYTNRGRAYFLQSSLSAAVADFEHVIAAAPSSSTALEAALMLHVAMKRQGHDDAQQLALVAAAADLSKWPGPVLKLDLGQMTADEVMVAAASAGSDRREGQLCEANYFTGEDALLHQQRTTALARLKAASDGCPKRDGAYSAAQVELKRLGTAAAPAK
jgi:Flp pilus assembly protein TadD